MVDLSKKIKQLPGGPGVYLFKNTTGTVIYAGKAINLKRRVSQYFQTSLTHTPKTNELAANIADLSIITTLNEFDALLLEAKLIKTYWPKYNIAAKDDKSPIYVHISLRDQLPKINLVRKIMLAELTNKKDMIFGPFQSGKIIKMLLRTIRRIIPYCTQNIRTGKPCFYTHLELCNPCPSVIEKMPASEEKKRLTLLYRRQIQKIKMILSGNTNRLIQILNKEMRNYANKEHYEDANRIKLQIKQLTNLNQKHFDPMTYLTDISEVEESVQKQLADLQAILKPDLNITTSLFRIECIDISNINGQLATGSLVVLNNGRIDTSCYRKFKIKTVHTANDAAMISEVVRRRFKHKEWPYPDLLVIDGGKGQVASAIQTLQKLNLNLPVIGLAKQQEDIVILDKNTFRTIRIAMDRPAIQILKRIRDESHRFALSYHRLLRRQALSATIKPS